MSVATTQITMGLLALAALAIYLRLSDILRGGLRCLLFIFGFLVVLGVHKFFRPGGLPALAGRGIGLLLN
jgi:hypothetical protein